jgi:hypothetical protein
VFLLSRFAEDVADEEDEHEESEGDGSIEEISPGDFGMLHSQQMDAIAGV